MADWDLWAVKYIDFYNGIYFLEVNQNGNGIVQTLIKN